MYRLFTLFKYKLGPLTTIIPVSYTHLKCEFGKSQIKFLGHIISADGVSTDPEKIQAITDFPKPNKAKDIRAFLGLTGYFCRFAPEYLKTIEPLMELLRKNTKWRWEERNEAAFNATKDLYSKNLHISHPEKKGLCT